MSQCHQAEWCDVMFSDVSRRSHHSTDVDGTTAGPHLLHTELEEAARDRLDACGGIRGAAQGGGGVGGRHARLCVFDRGGVASGVAGGGSNTRPREAGVRRVRSGIKSNIQLVKRESF
jgi:hypothetical protein